MKLVQLHVTRLGFVVISSSQKIEVEGPCNPDLSMCWSVCLCVCVRVCVPNFSFWGCLPETLSAEHVISEWCRAPRQSFPYITAIYVCYLPPHMSGDGRPDKLYLCSRRCLQVVVSAHSATETVSWQHETSRTGCLPRKASEDDLSLILCP